MAQTQDMMQRLRPLAGLGAATEKKHFETSKLLQYFQECGFGGGGWWRFIEIVGEINVLMTYRHFAKQFSVEVFVGVY